MQTKLKVKLMSHTPDAERLVATAAKLCYSSSDIEALEEKQTDEAVKNFLTMLLDMGHESPVEHVSFTFAVEGVSRALTHQLVRHRIASYSQQSQRYVNASQFKYIIPPAIEACEIAKERFIQNMESTQQDYDFIVNALIIESCSALVPMSIPPCDRPDFLKEENPRLFKALEKKAYEDARYVLPNAAETKIIITMNVRSLLNFIKHRSCDRAQWEIGDLSQEMYLACKSVAPQLFKYAGPACAHGKCTEGKMCCGKQLIKKQLYA